jgi:hypothetical protein
VQDSDPDLGPQGLEGLVGNLRLDALDQLADLSVEVFLGLRSVNDVPWGGPGGPGVLSLQTQERLAHFLLEILLLVALGTKVASL